MGSLESDRLKTIKDDIKAIVVSNKSRMTVNDLNREYLKIVGKRLSTVEFGHKNVQEFLQHECADIMKIEKIRGETYLCPILKTEAGKNLNSLILQQRSTVGLNGKRNAIVTSPANVRNGTLKNDSLTKQTSKIDVRTEALDKSTRSDKHKEPKPTAALAHSISKSNDKMRIVSEIKENLQNLIIKHKKLQGSELSMFYELKFKKPLDVEKLGYSNVLSFFRSFPEDFAVQKLHESDDWVVYDRSIEYEKEFWTAYRDNLDKKKNRKTSLNTLIFGLEALPYIDTDPELMPEDCIPFGQKLNLIEPPPVDTEIKIYVSEVLDPSHFWYHINSSEHREALSSLMIEMDIFYKSNKNAYKMTRAQMKPGHYCAVKFYNEYHRAVVLRNISENVIKVRYIDYGTIEEVPADDVRLLLKKFGRLKIQALPARLHGVRPSNHIWSHAARKKFLQLTNNKQLDAFVSNVDQQNVSSLILVDKNLEFFSVVSQVLYEEGMAKFISSDTKHWTFLDYIHLIPGFDDLESGNYPMFIDFERNTEKSLLFETLLFSFCDILNYKVPFKQTTSTDPPHCKQIYLNQNMNDLAINHINASNFPSSQYQLRLNNFKNVPNYPIHDLQLYESYRRLSMNDSMELQHNFNGPPYANPKVNPTQFVCPNIPNNIPNVQLQFFENEFERHSSYGSAPRLINKLQNDPKDLRQIDEINQNPILHMELPNNSYNVRHNKIVDVNINAKDEKCLEPNNKFNIEEDSPNMENTLALIDAFRIAGQDIDIWKLKYKNNYIKSPFIFLEQIFYYFIKPDAYQKFWNKLNSNNVQFELFQLNFPQLSDLRHIETRGKSGAMFGENFKFHSMSKEIRKTKENLILIKIEHISYFLKYHNKDLKIRYQDIVVDMLPVLEKYM